MKGKPWDEAVDTPKLRKLVEEGLTISKAAASMDKPRGTAIRKAREAGITTGRGRPRRASGSVDEDAARGFPRCGVCDFFEAGRSARLNTEIERTDTCRFHTQLIDGAAA
jgi:hypothetical protein